MTRAFSVENHIDRGMAKLAREAQARALAAHADQVVSDALAKMTTGKRGDFALALLERAAQAVSTLHDGPRTQACLGAVAAKHGADLPGAKPAARREAERLFRKGRG